MKKLILIALLVAGCQAWADSSNGDPSDRGGTFEEMSANQSWGDPADAFMEDWFGKDWQCKTEPHQDGHGR